MSTLPDDDHLFLLLERYLRELQAGETPDRGQLLEQYPDLAPVLDCLEALESIAAADQQSTGSATSGRPDASLPPDTGACSNPADADADSAPLDRFAERSSGGSKSASAIADSSDTATLRDTPAPPAASETFGDYELIEEIGRGGMGVVYKARQRSLDRLVAIKMILAGQLASPEHVQRFIDEARAAARLSHPNIIPIYEVGQYAGQHYFTMEYVEGESLQQRLKAGPLDIETAVRIVQQVARAVAYLHQNGMVHRDLKPSNIILDKDGTPYVTDFGLAKVAAGDWHTTASGAILGTPSYMAPEQAAGRSRQAGPAADVYSLGAILYELLTGKPPFREDSALDTLLKVLGSDPPSPRSINRHIPAELELLCLKCLAKSPEARYPNAQALADELERFRTGEPLLARPPGLLRRIWNFGRRQPALAARLGVVGGFLVLDLLTRAITPLDLAFHNRLELLLVVAAVAAVGFQRLLRYWEHPNLTCLVWGLFDQVLLFHVLLIGNGVASPATIVYPMLIVGSALWFRVRFVWFMTAVGVASYWIHVADFYLRRDELVSLIGTRWDRHAIFTLALVAIGLTTGYIVRRIRLLGRYYGHQLSADGSD